MGIERLAMTLYGIDDIRVFYQNDLRFLRQFTWGGVTREPEPMKISLNWIRDYVALDAPVEEITRALTFLGFEVEQVASDRRAAARERRRRRGADARQAPERRQALRVHGRRRARRRRADDRLRRAELQGGRPGPGGAPGRRPAGRLHDQAVEDPRPALRRHDVLGRSSAWGGRPRRTPHPGGPAAARRPDQRGASARATPSSTSRSRPTARTASRTSAWPASSRPGSARTSSIPRRSSGATSPGRPRATSSAASRWTPPRTARSTRRTS
jgi:hypothetical protein